MNAPDVLLFAPVPADKSLRRQRRRADPSWRVLTGCLLFSISLTGSSPCLAGQTETEGPTPVHPVVAELDLNGAAQPPVPQGLVVTIVKRNTASGKDTGVPNAWVQIVGPDSDGGGTDASGIVHLSMPTNAKINLRVSVASYPTCILNNVSINRNQPALKVLLSELSTTRCTARVIPYNNPQ